MKQHEDEAIVLDIRPARDADRSVVLLASSGELVPTYAPAAARSRRRFGGALMPGARVRARWTVQREGGLAVLQELQLVGDAPSPDPLERFYAASHVLEVTRAFAREGAEDPRMYRLLRSVLERIAAGDPIDPLARYFEAWVLRLAGLLPESAGCSACGASLDGAEVVVVPDEGAFCTEHAPAGGRHLSRRAAAWLAATRDRPPERLPPLGDRDGEALAGLLTGTIVGFTERRLKAWPALAALRGRARGREG